MNHRVPGDCCGQTDTMMVGRHGGFTQLRFQGNLKKKMTSSDRAGFIQAGQDSTKLVLVTWKDWVKSWKWAYFSECNLLLAVLLFPSGSAL